MSQIEQETEATAHHLFLGFEGEDNMEEVLAFIPAQGLLIGRHGEQELRPKAAQLLQLFVSSPDRSLSHLQIRKEILHQLDVPKREAPVADKNTRNLVSEIRQAIQQVSGRHKSAVWPIANQHRAHYRLNLTVKRCWTPRPLPAQPASFVCSTNYCLKDLETQLLNPAASVISFYGRPGSGKTSLLAALLEEIKQTGELRRGANTLRFSAVYYYSRRNWTDVLSSTIEADLRRAPALPSDGDTLPVKDASKGQNLIRLLEQPAPGWRLCIIDDVDDYDFAQRDLADEDLRQVISAFAQTRQNKLLIVSPAYPVGLIAAYGQRSAKVGLVPDTVQDQILTKAETVQLLDQLAKQNARPLVPAAARPAPDTEYFAAELHRLTGGHPKALTQLYEWLVIEGTQPLTDVLQKLGALLPRHIPAAISRHYQDSLQEQDRVVLKTLAIFKQPTRPTALFAILARWYPDLPAESVLSRLNAGNLILRKDDDLYHLHSIEQTYYWELIVQELAAPADTQRPPTSRDLCLAVAHYLQQMRHQEARRNFPDFDRLRQWAIAAVDLLTLAEAFDEAAATLLSFDRAHLMYTNQWRELKPRYSALLGKTQDEECSAQLLNRYGTVLLCLGSVSEAIPFYRQAHALGEHLNHLELRLKTANNLASCHYLRGELSTAFACFAEARRLAATQGFPRDRRVADLISGMADCQLLLGQPAQALAMQREALEVGEEWLDQYALTSQNYRGVLSFIAHQHKQIGVCERELGHYAAALDCFAESIQRALEIGNRATLGYALCEQAETLLVQWYAAVLKKEASQFSESSHQLIEKVRQQIAQAQRYGSEIGNPELWHHAAVLLTLINLHDPQCPAEKAAEHLRELEETRAQAATDFQAFGFETRLLSAVCAFNEGKHLLAGETFTRAGSEIRALIEAEPQFVKAQEGLALAYTGVALCQRRHRKRDSGRQEKELAINHYRVARNLTATAGTAVRALFWFDALRHEQHYQEIRATCIPEAELDVAVAM